MKRSLFAALLLFTLPAQAVDRDGYGLTLTPSQRQYVKELKNNNGVPCCDDADGFEAEWDYDPTAVSGYKARMPDGSWVQVPPEAVITPNLLGAARMWVVHYSTGDWYVRCFLAGEGN